MSDDPSVETEKSRRLLAGIVLVAIGAAIFLGYLATRRKPDAAAPAAVERGAARPEPTPTPDPGEPLAFRQAASRDEPPFAAARSPFEVKLDGEGRIWILDSPNSRIRLFDREGGFLGGWGGLGSGQFSFKTPEGLAISGDNLYVADTWNHRVIRYSLKGEWKGQVAAGFMGPRGVAVGSDGSVWVTDTGNHRVVKFNAALENEQIVGPTGTKPGEFKSPVGIAVSRSGLIYIADTGNGRIQIFDKDGTYKSSWSLPWLEKSWMARLAVGEDGTVYASVPGGPEVIAFDASGASARHWAADDSGEKFVLPEGLTIDHKKGVLYVADGGTRKLMSISLSGPKAR